ncbi:MAG: hypothetical protein HGA45_16210 [Chloroflexales bacterium]|nr:hypothetical protein [Chloroflexales bacterium]
MSRRQVSALLLLTMSVVMISCGARTGETGRKAPARQETIESFANSETGHLWGADHETGDLSQWRDGGRISTSGKAKATISQQVAHSGRYSLALSIKDANGTSSPSPGVRMGWEGRGWVTTQNALNLPNEAYYSTYYYFPQVVKAEWWNLMQWKQAYVRLDGSQSRNPVYFISAVFQDGQMLLILRSKVDPNGSYVDPGTTAATAPIALPVNSWVQIECYYRWSTAPDGRITCWQGGNLIWDVTNIVTEFTTEFVQYPRQWTVNNYADKTTPPNQTIFIDDALISLKRIGP